MLQYLELPAQAAVVRPEAGIGFGGASGVPQNHRAGAEGGGAGAQHGDAVVAAAVGFAAGEPLRAPYGETLRLLPDTASQGGQRRRNRRQAVALLIPQPAAPVKRVFVPGRSAASRASGGSRSGISVRSTSSGRQRHRAAAARSPWREFRRRPVTGHSTAQGPYRQPVGRCGPVRLRVQGHGPEPLPTRYREAAIRLADVHAAATQHRQRQVYIGAGGQGAGQRQLRVCRQTGRAISSPESS